MLKRPLLNNQHNTIFSKQPLPVVESVEEEDDPSVAVENASSEDEENTVEESDERKPV